eukprot:SAG25_NODE_801_length_5268_cov_3.548849_7_plen_51_part_00
MGVERVTEMPKNPLTFFGFHGKGGGYIYTSVHFIKNLLFLVILVILGLSA